MFVGTQSWSKTIGSKTVRECPRSAIMACVSRTSKQLPKFSRWALGLSWRNADSHRFTSIYMDLDLCQNSRCLRHWIHLDERWSQVRPNVRCLGWSSMNPSELMLGLGETLDTLGLPSFLKRSPDHHLQLLLSLLDCSNAQFPMVFVGVLPGPAIDTLYR